MRTFGSFFFFMLLAIDSLAQSGAPFTVDRARYMSNHDIVFNSPAYEGYEAFPLGNGDLGAMIHSTPTGLAIQVNKNDAWDYEGENGEMLLRSCGQLKLDFGLPLFDWLYLDDYKARLSLYEAEAKLESRTPFNRFSAKARVQADRNLLVVRIKTTSKGVLGQDPGYAQVRMDRWGSRAFGGWYNSLYRPADAGLGKAEAGVNGKDIYIQETFRNLRFTMAARVIAPNTQLELLNRHTAQARAVTAGQDEIILLVSVVTSNESDDPFTAAIELLDKAELEGMSSLDQSHASWWQNYWDRSFVHIGDNYLENLYYNHFYLMGSSSRGRYPAIFNGALWTWNRDVRQWISPHHWNTQQSYWSLNAANHGDLMQPYLNTYFRLLPHAEKFAAERGYKQAALWSEKHDFRGSMLSWNAHSFINNFTPASQMGQLFWQHYQFTQNLNFLRDTAYPFMRKSAEFYLQYLAWDPVAKRYNMPLSSPYESEEDNALKNTITDLATIRVSFQACVEASNLLQTDRDKRAKWQHVLDHLSPYPLGYMKDVGETFAISETGKDTIVGKHHDYSFCRINTPVFPAGDIGLSQKGSRYFDAALRRAKLHPRNTLAITPAAVVAARLGLADQAYEHLLMSVRQLQHFPQGLFYNLDHWSYLSHYVDKFSDGFVATQRDYINDKSVRYKNIPVFENGKKNGRISTPAVPFVQSGMEPSAILAMTINEMLLQSHDGVIRVFPSVPANWPAAFTLLAKGGFLVSSEKAAADTVPVYIAVKSVSGRTCQVAGPWSGQTVVYEVKNNQLLPLKAVVSKNGVLQFNTKAETVYLLAAKGSPVSLSSSKTYTAGQNTTPKLYKEAIIGKARDF